jgi:hypothetical protein
MLNVVCFVVRFMCSVVLLRLLMDCRAVRVTDDIAPELSAMCRGRAAADGDGSEIRPAVRVKARHTSTWLGK